LQTWLKASNVEITPAYHQLYINNNSKNKMHIERHGINPFLDTIHDFALSRPSSTCDSNVIWGCDASRRS
jgi:hypothetical protein